MKMEDKTIQAIAAMGCITVIELFAIYNKIDGTVLAAVIGAITGLGGYFIGKKNSPEHPNP